METEVNQDKLESPFDRKNLIVNQVFFLGPWVVATYAVAKHKPRKLPIFIAANFAFFTVLRYPMCARCQYYGQPCSTFMGIMTAKMMPRNESRPMGRNDLLNDFIYAFAPAFYALPQILKDRKIAMLYFTSLSVCLMPIIYNSCGKCGNNFCPMKDLRKVITKDSNKQCLDSRTH
jgi:hypothetical protein